MLSIKKSQSDIRIWHIVWSHIFILVNLLKTNFRATVTANKKCRFSRPIHFSMFPIYSAKWVCGAQGGISAEMRRKSPQDPLCYLIKIRKWEFWL